MPKNRTLTTATPRSAIEGCKAAFEINQAEVAMRLTLLTMVNVPRSVASNMPRQKGSAKRRTRQSGSGFISCHQTRVVTTRSYQLGVSALLDNRAIVDEHNSVSVKRRAQMKEA